MPFVSALPPGIQFKMIKVEDTTLNMQSFLKNCLQFCIEVRKQASHFELICH